MRRRILPTLCLFSLVCSAALAGMGAWGWGQGLYVRYASPAAPLTAIARCEDGVATFVWWRSTFGGVSGWDAGRGELRPAGRLGAQLRDAAAGFGVRSGTIGWGRSTVVSVPLWPAILLTALPPAAWYVRRRKRGARGFEVGMA